MKFGIRIIRASRDYRGNLEEYWTWKVQFFWMCRVFELKYDWNYSKFRFKTFAIGDEQCTLIN